MQRPLPSKHAPTTRSACLHNYLEVTGRLHVDGKALLHRAGLADSAPDDPDSPISLEAVCRLLESSAEACSADDFSLRLVAHRQLSTLGLLGLVVREQSSAIQALEAACRYLCLINNALIIGVESHGEFIVIREDMALPAQVPIRQAIEYVVAVLHQSLAELLGPAWRPVRACFTHRPPADTRAHRRFFGVAVDFNAEFNGIVCRRADMQRPLPRTNCDSVRLAMRTLDEAAGKHRPDAAEMTQRLIFAMLPTGVCTIEKLAQYLEVDRRTVHRHLAAEGTTFKDVLQATRVDLAQRWVSTSDRRISDIATMLGFAMPSAFSTWFSRTFGASPSEWRKLG